MLLYPDKCIFCRQLLQEAETDLCHGCRETAPVVTKSKKRFPLVAGWTAVWYYKENVREALLRFKFYHQRSYGDPLARHLAMKLRSTGLDDFDILTYVPVSRLRKWRRGYDQTQLIAEAVARELGIPLTRCLVKHKHTRPQSGLPRQEQRRANISGAYRTVRGLDIRGKRVLLLDDIITTGATISECAAVLLAAGAAEVRVAAVAVSPEENNK